MSRQSLVCDTTVLLYLGRIDQAPLLPALFEPIYVPEAILAELDMGRRSRLDTIDPRTLPWAVIVSANNEDTEALPPNRLGIGERAVIAYARRAPGCWAGLDDREARELAEEVGLGVVGTIGLLLRAKRAGLVSTIRPHLKALRSQGFHMSGDLYHEALRLADEE